MPPQEQADLWMQLRDRMKNDWHELTLQERKAGMCTIVITFALYGELEKSAGGGRLALSTLNACTAWTRALWIVVPFGLAA